MVLRKRRNIVVASLSFLYLSYILSLTKYPTLMLNSMDLFLADFLGFLYIYIKIFGLQKLMFIISN
jgi:hypothetical protein